MRFLCKKCGAQSPGDISEVEIRDGALVFTCKACGASATLVESRAKSGASSAANGNLAEKGIVEPDEDELVDLGEATLSRMLGKKVRIVAAIEDVASPQAPPPRPALASEAAVEPVPQATVPATVPVSVTVPQSQPEPQPEPEGVPAPLLVVEGGALPASASNPDVSPWSRRSRVFMSIAASVGLLAVATVALLEARPQRSSPGGVPVSASPAGPSSSPPLPTEAPVSAGIPPETVPAATPNAVRSDPARAAASAEKAAARAEVKELDAPNPAPAVPEPGSESLSAEQVDAAFFRVRPGVRMCAVQEQRRHPDAGLGDEPVILSVAPSGAVTRVEFESHELAGTPLGACLALELEKFRVEASAGRPAVVRRVLELSRQGARAN